MKTEGQVDYWMSGSVTMAMLHCRSWGLKLRRNKTLCCLTLLLSLRLRHVAPACSGWISGTDAWVWKMQTLKKHASACLGKNRYVSAVQHHFTSGHLHSSIRDKLIGFGSTRKNYCMGVVSSTHPWCGAWRRFETVHVASLWKSPCWRVVQQRVGPFLSPHINFKRLQKELN